MSVPDLLLLALRVFHALAAMIWLGGGIYYLVAVVPATRGHDESGAVASRAQQYFGEWAQPATLVMLATGMVLVFDRLSEGKGGLTYAGLLGFKILAALAAFGLVLNRRRGRRTRTDLVVLLGLIAFGMGVVLSSVWQ
ncbi:MAG: copper resistance protein CopD [Chloroflexota bacterium]